FFFVLVALSHRLLLGAHKARGETLPHSLLLRLRRRLLWLVPGRRRHDDWRHGSRWRRLELLRRLFVHRLADLGLAALQAFDVLGQLILRANLAAQLSP